MGGFAQTNEYKRARLSKILDALDCLPEVKSISSLAKGTKVQTLRQNPIVYREQYSAVNCSIHDKHCCR